MSAIERVYRDATKLIDERVDNLLSQMTLAEKIGQMTQIEKNSIPPEDVTTYAIGSVLSGGGGNPDPNTAQTWANMVREYATAAQESRLGIPLIYGVDAVHGHNNLKDATIFPHNIGLGATRDPDLVRRIGKATAREILATGIHWDFAPAVSAPQDVRWGRIYEGYSQNPDLIIELSTAFIEGLQNPDMGDTWVLACAKHFVGDGGTTWGSTKIPAWTLTGNWQVPDQLFKIDQGNTEIDETELRKTHLAPYIAAIEAGVMNIMVSHSSWHGVKMHDHRYLLTDVLKTELGFTGFLVSDWMSINQIDEDYYTCVVRSINAGLDMNMVPYDYRLFIDTLTKAVEKGDVSQERIDDAVRRILHVKFALGLFERPFTDETWLSYVGAEEHRDLAREAVQKSAVLLKNENNALPLNKDDALLAVGEAVDDIGLACGGWTIDWQGSAGAITKGATLLDGLNHHCRATVSTQIDDTSLAKLPVGIVVIAEQPYAEGNGDCPDLHMTDAQKQMVKQTREHCEKLVLVMYSGRPIIITDVVDDCDAIVASWLPGSEANALADVLYGDVPFTGKLAVDWLGDSAQVPRSQFETVDAGWAYGHGLTT